MRGDEHIERVANDVWNKTLNFLRTGISDGVNADARARLDPSTESLVGITYPHHKIHDGNHFLICAYDTWANAAIKNFVVTPATKEAHMRFRIEGTDAASIEIWEGATLNATPGGTTLVPICNNRVLAKTSDGVYLLDPTIDDDGSKIYANYSGAHRTSGLLARANEIILKPGITYVFRITNETVNNNVISYCGEWYEHEPFN